MTATPTFLLPACPLCSHRGMTDRPIWRFASNTSAKRGKKSYFFSGCRHATESAHPTTIWDDPADWSRIEADWQARTEKLFAGHTATWTEPQRVTFRRMLGDRSFLPGTTERIEFTPDSPASTETETETTNG